MSVRIERCYRIEFRHFIPSFGNAKRSPCQVFMRVDWPICAKLPSFVRLGAHVFLQSVAIGEFV
jgi:hypothetical protein